MFLFNEDRVSIWDDKEVLERDLGDGCTTLCSLNATDLYAVVQDPSPVQLSFKAKRFTALSQSVMRSQSFMGSIRLMGRNEYYPFVSISTQMTICLLLLKINPTRVSWWPSG